MSKSVEEKLSEQFYSWELRGRGWQVWDYPVDLEPPFRPFYGHYVPREELVDDGARPTFLSRLVGQVREALSPGSTKPVVAPQEEEEEPIPDEIDSERELAELQITLPATFKVENSSFEQFLRSISTCKDPISLELIANSEDILVQFTCSLSDARRIEQQIKSHFPDAIATRQNFFLETVWYESKARNSAIIDFGLSEPFMVPLLESKRIELDPFVALTGALVGLQEGEVAVLQILFKPVSAPWAESMVQSVTYPDGTPFFVNAPKLVPKTEQKISRPLYAAVVRIGVRSFGYDRIGEIAESLAGALCVFSSASGNSFIPLSNDDYDAAHHEDDLLKRSSRRSGMILNSDELVGLVHLPSSAVKSSQLVRQLRKTKAAPSIAVGHQLVIGENNHAGKRVSVSVGREARSRHMHVIGASGTGKSTLLFNMIRQDIEKGEGVGVLDPHGDLIDRILSIVPENRIQDVVLVDPSDEEYVIGFNVLSAHSDFEKNLLASDLVSVFERLSTSWGDQMASVLQNTLLAFLESDKGGTLADVQRFLLDANFRKEFLKTVHDPQIAYYWRKGFQQLSGNRSIGPVLTRLNAFLSPKAIRYMVSQRENRLDFGNVLDTGKIFLGRLPQGLIGNENAYLLGSLFVSKFQQTAMARQRVSEDRRRDFWLYVDEFHNFITPSMAEILTGARKYRLGLVLAHHELRQLDQNSDVAGAVMSTPYTRVVFRVGDQDARVLERGFSSFHMSDLQNLPTGEAVCRMERSDFDFNLKIPWLEQVDKKTAAERRTKIINESRSRYAKKRSIIEEELSRHVETDADEEESKPESINVSPTQSKTPKEPLKETKTPAEKINAEETKNESGPKPHEVFKELIAREAQALGYKVGVEKDILDGAGRVDVILQRGERRIACQISSTTSAPHEVGNARKCLEEDFWHVAMICEQKRRLEKVRNTLSTLVTEKDFLRMGYYSTEEFLQTIKAWIEKEPITLEESLKQGPMKQKFSMSFDDLTPDELKREEQELLRKLTENMRKNKKMLSAN